MRLKEIDLRLFENETRILGYMRTRRLKADKIPSVGIPPIWVCATREPENTVIIRYFVSLVVTLLIEIQNKSMGRIMM